ncbi:hypothetical protein [Rhizobium halophilum]|uniref:hypothetical protein n=1 Tax=Rhizobium halophilum TaxID=2846852 RepID=UPI001EFCD8D4|nr:hypothetical protein [Rhizobium halophilum]MCF6369609.1 hypothetical protein [Rhizobium halophilum]
MGRKDRSDLERQQEMEREGAVGSGKPKGAFEQEEDNLANASRETRINYSKKTER